MVAAGVLEHNTFSMCFDYSESVPSDSGTMVLGGYDSTLHTSEMLFTAMVHSTGWYTVHLDDILLGYTAETATSIGQSASSYQAGKGMIVDSGTTDTYLPKACATKFKALWAELSGHTFSTRYTLTPPLRSDSNRQIMLYLSAYLFLRCTVSLIYNLDNKLSALPGFERTHNV
jgi:hypothetical protein